MDASGGDAVVNGRPSMNTIKKLLITTVLNCF